MPANHAKGREIQKPFIFRILSRVSRAALRFFAMFRSFLALVVTLSIGGLLATHAADRPPNVIVIFTDNQGAWTLGCYGNKDIKTPNIDRMAREGVRFANSFANNPVCSPNRATLLTGLLPSQHGVHVYLGGGYPQMGEGAYCVISEFATLPRIMKSHGYACGMVGKWHLGANISPQEGLTDEWITMPAGHTSTFFDADIIENGAVRKEPTHLTTFWTQHALQFIEKEKDKPFFLYLCYNGPYGLGPAQLKDRERAPHWQDYQNTDLPSFPRLPMNPWQFNNKEFLNNIDCIRRYAAEVTNVDDGVGAVLDKVKSLGLDENTIIIYAGDNGWAGGQNGLWGMGDHTRPINAYDAQMRVPIIWRHAGHIPAGTVSQHLVAHVSFMPSLLDYLGLTKDIPTNEKLTGRSYAAILRGKDIPDWDETIYYEAENMRCIRTPKAKLVERIAGDPSEYYQLDVDPDEKNNLWDKPDATAASLKEKLHQHFDSNADPRYDLWHGGISKAKPLVYPKPANAKAPKN
jgi:arylsulfatase A-like enzyme